MKVLFVSWVVFAALFSTLCIANQNAIVKDIVNSAVERTVDLTTHLPKITTLITLKNTGKTAVKSFLYALEPELKDHLSYFGAKLKSDDTKLSASEVSVTNQQGKIFYKVNLAKSLSEGQDIQVEIETFYSHTLTPYPSHIRQAEKQLVQLKASSLFYSPYTTLTETTTVNCASNNIESYTKTNPVKVSDSSIVYGPNKDTEAFSQSEMVIHFENNTPFLTVTHLERLIEVSHWGNIAVEDTIDIRHSGALLKGSFSRYDYQRQTSDGSSVKSFKTVLPTSARDVYYRDEIGNISTSSLREMEDMVEVELTPRFPLFGGWKTHYILGYNVPSYQYLFNSGDNYLLKMRFVDHIFDDQVIDEVSIKIILPEGSKNIDFQAPYEVEHRNGEPHFTYLDTVGRPVIVAKKTNLVEHHCQDFELRYSFGKFMLLQEPLLLVGAFYLLFLTVIIYVRMDFAISKDEASESRMRVASILEQVQATHVRRSALYQSYDDAIDKYKHSRDNPTFMANRKKIDGQHKQLTSEIDLLHAKLKAEGSDVVEKTMEIQQLDRQMREQINTAAQHAERLIAGKLQKQQYLDQDETIRNKRKDLYQKMESLVAAL